MSSANLKTHARRPKNDEITKYEHPLPFHLDEWLGLYLTTEPIGDYERELVDEFTEYILTRIRDHWKDSAKTRMLFSNMSPDTVWVDFATKTMHLTARNLATLDPKFLPELEHHLLEVEQKLVHDISLKLEQILKAIYANEAEIEYVNSTFTFNSDNDYSIANYAGYRRLLNEMERELKAKFAVIEFARQREIFLTKLVAWEASHKSIASDKHARGANNLLNWIPKFRIDTVKIFHQSNATLKKLISDYKEQTGKTFSLKTHVYEEENLQKHIGQVAKVQTNFSFFTADTMYFSNPHGDSGSDEIVGRELDPLISYIVESSDAVALVSPPAMPVFAEEVAFAFKYY